MMKFSLAQLVSRKSALPPIQNSHIAERKSMSPPSAEQWVLISKDAMAIALELEQLSHKSGSKSSSSSSAESSSTTHSDSNPAGRNEFPFDTVPFEGFLDSGLIYKYDS